MQRDFLHDQHRSERPEAQWFWGDVYRIGFPLFNVGETIARKQKQVLGHDRNITSPKGEVFVVEEKLREMPYGDVLLEDLSSINNNIPGWMEKQLECDILIYGTLSCSVEPEAIIFDYHELRDAWLEFGVEWKRLAHVDDDWYSAVNVGQQGFSYVRSANNGYTTGNVGVPKDLLLSLCKKSRVIHPPKRYRWGPRVGQISA